MNQILLPLAAALLVSLVSLLGAFTLRMSAARLRALVPLLVSLAVGVLLGDAFLHLIPEAAATLGSVSTVCLFVLAGIVLFFAIEKAVRWRHSHELPEGPSHAAAPTQLARMNLVGDAVHNFIDGVLIAGSFAVDPWLGLTTAAAIVVHEIPQEIGDVGALIHGGYAPRRAVWLNFCCALSVFPGVLLALAVGLWAEELLPYLLPVTAGGFIYIATADFIPALHAHDGAANGRRAPAQLAAMMIGVACMFAVGVFEESLVLASGS